MSVRVHGYRIGLARRVWFVSDGYDNPIFVLRTTSGLMQMGAEFSVEALVAMRKAHKNQVQRRD
ncbi:MULTISPECIES: hypothetical protein [Rhodococcus erythropolis group]|uniref:hypothetical protein n=1 Tax=Rhodococcus erythropolis group TaxID=2840174 RepID=UPI001161376A|nr:MULTISPECIES: hypothetical protein [Rhodococcus erythropolis group]MCZ4548216.1 hypothetical protein [Rhodococcus qingshengii]